MQWLTGCVYVRRIYHFGGGIIWKNINVSNIFEKWFILHQSILLNPSHGEKINRLSLSNIFFFSHIFYCNIDTTVIYNTKDKNSNSKQFYLLSPLSGFQSQNLFYCNILQTKEITLGYESYNLFFEGKWCLCDIWGWFRCCIHKRWIVVCFYLS